MQLSATMIETFYRCREEFRKVYVEKLPRPINIDQFFGTVVHKGIETLWKTATDSWQFAIIFNAATKKSEELYVSSLNPKQIDKWNKLMDSLPYILDAYLNYWEDNPMRKDLRWSEHEWEIHGTHQPHTSIRGRCDLVFNYSGPLPYPGVSNDIGAKMVILHEIKTASEIGKEWRESYRQGMIRNTGLALYDWYLRQTGYNVIDVGVEVLIKPYKDKKARIEILNLPEIMAARSRHDVELKFKVAEITHYMESYKQMNPWPMANGQACLGKYEPCPFLKVCNYG